MAKNFIERSYKMRMTKPELEEAYKRTLEENRLLGEAVEAKDKEIAQLRETQEKQIEQVQMLDAENLKKENEFLKNTLTRREKELNKLIILHGNLLKALQGNLDNAIELNEYFVNEVSK
jgi:hypothetical protein